MESYSRKGLVQATNNNRLYDYIAEHYYEMPRDDLKEVLLAVLGVGYDKCHGEADEKAYMKLIIEELGNRYFEDYE